MTEKIISESELEDDSITPEIVPSNQLQTLVIQSGLPATKSQVLLERFADHFKLAAEWAKKAKDIIVTSGDQVVTIKHARAGRLLLREKRLDIENIRKLLKADALKEGQAIDRIANFLKDLIIPTEEHLDRQEHFVEYKKKAEDDAKRIEIEDRLEQERIDQERLNKEKQDKLLIENKRLQEEATKREHEEQQKEKERLREIEKLQIEKYKVEEELRAKKQEELKKEADKIRAEENLAKAGDTEKMIAFRIAVQSIKIPDVKSVENRRIIEEAKGYLYLAINKIKLEEE